MKKYLPKKPVLNAKGIMDELPFWSAPFGIKLMEMIDYKTNISVLDIGCGSGFLLIELSQRLGNASTIYGIDPNTESLQAAQRKMEHWGIKNIQLLEGVAENIPLSDKSIDLITSNNGINNVQDLDKVLSECSRLLKPHGQFIQAMNTEQTMVEFYDELIQVLMESHQYQKVDEVHKHIAEKRPPLALLRTKLIENGFILRNQVIDQFNYTFANGTCMLNHFFIQLAFMDSWKKLVPENQVQSYFEKLEERLNKKSELLGCLHLSVPFAVLNSYKLD